jgi:hypothetical protein
MQRSSTRGYLQYDGVGGRFELFTYWLLAFSRSLHHWGLPMIGRQILISSAALHVGGLHAKS